MWYLSLSVLAFATQADLPQLSFQRDADGVAAAVGELLPQLQTCVNGTEETGVHLMRLRFEISTSGQPGPVAPMRAPNNVALTECLSTPFARLRFDPGMHPLPVEIPISILVEEEYRTEIRPPSASRLATADPMVSSPK